MNKNKHVIGFITNANRIMLIEKKKPAWQKGMFNGVAGQILEDEDPAQAISREAQAQTGLSGLRWTEIFMKNKEEDVFYLNAETSTLEFNRFKKDAAEDIHVFSIEVLPDNCVHNVREAAEAIKNRGHHV